MSINHSLLSIIPPVSVTVIRRFCIAASFCLVISATAQSILVSDSSGLLIPRAAQDSSPSAVAPSARDQVAPIEFGRFRLHPLLMARYIQANDLPVGAGLTVDSSIATFSAGLLAEVGDHWVLNYTPTWVNYSAASLRDSVNHSFSLAGNTKVNDWTLQFSEAFQSSLDVLAETAEQTKQRTWATVFSAGRKVGNRSSYEGTVSLDERYADRYPDSKTWSTQQWLKMQMSPKLNVGLGINLGYTDLTNQANMKYVHYLGQVNWKPSEKVTVSLQGGTETRRSQAASADSLHSPILQTTLEYRPLANTRFSLTSFRTVTNSVLNNELTKNKGWSAGLNQRLLEKLNLNLTYNQQSSDYSAFGIATVPNPTIAGRSDDLKSFNSTLSVGLFQRWTLAAIYQTSKNTSNRAGFRISTNQYGLELRGKF